MNNTQCLAPSSPLNSDTLMAVLADVNTMSNGSGELQAAY